MVQPPPPPLPQPVIPVFHGMPQTNVPVYIDPHHASSQLNPHSVPGSGGWPATTSPYRWTAEDTERWNRQFYDFRSHQLYCDQHAHAEQAAASYTGARSSNDPRRYGPLHKPQHGAYGPVPKTSIAPLSPFDYGKDQK